MELDQLIKVARGEEKADLLLRNAQLVNVLSGEIHEADVALFGGLVVGLGAYEAREVIDLEGDYLSPGFIDGHVHIESTMIRVPEFARAVVPHGTTTVVIDPHEIANVMGLDGIRYMLESSKYNPLSVYVMVPSCVPSTGMETAGSHLTAYDIAPLLSDEWVLGVAEMMNYPGVLEGEPDVLEKIRIARHSRIDGHAPRLSGRDLNAYVAAGISSDHECTTLEEAREKLRLGMYIMIREGSEARNLEALLPLVTPKNARQFIFVCDDLLPGDLLDRGHIDHIIRKAAAFGLDPLLAIQLATINTARYFGLNDRGAVAPGYRADLVVFDNFQDLKVKKVFRGGQLVAQDGKLMPGLFTPREVPLRSSINVARIYPEDFRIKAEGKRAKVIGLTPQQVVTQRLVEEVKVEDGLAVADVKRDILKLAVIERHQASGNMGLGFVQGFGLKRGALASSVAHDSHNIIVVGTNDGDMLKAVVEIARMRGGLVVVADGEVLATLSLPIAGLMSDKSIEETRAELDKLEAVAQGLGCQVDNPFMAMSFLSLPVIPELKLTDKGLVDVTQFKIVPLFEDS
jgi:adenine deaminase